MNGEPALVLDTDAVMTYARGSLDLGERISTAADEEELVIVPALCLAEAYRRAAGDAWHYLDVLSTLGHVVVAPVEPDDCPFLGGYARKVGSKHLAQAVLEAASRPITPLMTSRREEVTQILPHEWPIIDL